MLPNINHAILSPSRCIVAYPTENWVRLVGEGPWECGGSTAMLILWLPEEMDMILTI